MRRTLAAALFAGLAGMAFAAPASALPSSTASTAVQLGENNAGITYVGRRDRVYRNRYYDRRYSDYRPYNRYSYYRPYSYGGYPNNGGYPYGYNGRPGISF